MAITGQSTSKKACSKNYDPHLKQLLQKLPLLLRYRRSRDSKNAIANFLKEVKEAALQLRSPPAVEAKERDLQELT